MDGKFIWWKQGVIYQLYVRSFYDSNNDGIGDIRGVIEKLDYLVDLGIDAIWLSPIFLSPQKDFGYDVEDYRLIDFAYGSNDDFNELLNKAHQNGIKIILDMVLNHTSDKHPWFVESRSSIDNPKRNWYIWQKPNGKHLPNNWKTAFFKKAWCYDKLTNEYYYHSFYKDQPDLNWNKKEVVNAMFNEVDFWLKQGVDGFRLDVINLIIKDKKLKNNPSLLQQYLFKKKVKNRNKKKSVRIVKLLRKKIDEYEDKVLVGEIYTSPPGDAKLVKKYLGNGKNALHLALDFSLMFSTWNPRKYARILQKSYNNIPDHGWATITMSNHDIVRSFSKHIFHKTEKAKLLAMILLTAYGTPFIYYGEEIGISVSSIPRKSIQDRIGKWYWPLYCGRDKLRTPMQWNNKAFAGFSSVKPWLPLNKNFLTVNVEKQKTDNNSLLSLYKSLIALRKKYNPLNIGDWQLLDVNNKKVLAYKRIYDNIEMEIILNFSKRAQKINNENRTIIFSTHLMNKNSTLYPFEGRITFNESTNC